VKTLEEIKTDYDWVEAFKATPGGTVRGVLGYGGSLAAVDIGDVVDVVATSEGVNDETSWIGAFLLKDGRHLFLSAWCDYTGWDCQSGCDMQVASDLASLVRFAMGNEERERLGFTLDEVTP
jgi:hypothetical protein